MRALTPLNIKDYGLVAYLRLKNFDVKKNADNISYHVSLSSQEFKIVTSDYFKNLKPILDGIKRIKKEISTPMS